MTGNVISLTPPHPGMPGKYDYKRAKSAQLPANAQDSCTDVDGPEPEPGRKKGRCPRPCSRRESSENSGTSMWKPVMLIIASLNIVALGGLVYSAPWKPMAEQKQTSVPSVRQQVQRKLLIPLEASITRDGKVSATYPRDFLSSAPADVRRSLLDSLREGAADDADRAAASSGHARQGAGSPESPESNETEADSARPLKQ